MKLEVQLAKLKGVQTAFREEQQRMVRGILQSREKMTAAYRAKDTELKAARKERKQTVDEFKRLKDYYEPTQEEVEDAHQIRGYAAATHLE